MLQGCRSLPRQLVEPLGNESSFCVTNWPHLIGGVATAAGEHLHFPEGNKGLYSVHTLRRKLRLVLAPESHVLRAENRLYQPADRGQPPSKNLLLLQDKPTGRAAFLRGRCRP